MSTITVSTRGHSCIVFRREGATLVVDPGVFSDPAAADDADAILVTHEHADHVMAEPLAAALGGAPDVHVWAPQGVVDQLAGAGADRGRLHVATPGDDIEAAGFRVRVVGGEHAVIHPDFGRIDNVGYLVEGVVLHPGDSLTPPPDGTALEVLLAPVAAPWLKLAEAADYVRAVGAPRTVPIHDAILSELGLSVVDGMMSGLCGSAYRRLGRGETLDVEVP